MPKVISPKEHNYVFLWDGLFKGNNSFFKYNFFSLFFSSSSYRMIPNYWVKFRI